MVMERSKSGKVVVQKKVTTEWVKFVCFPVNFQKVHLHGQKAGEQIWVWDEAAVQRIQSVSFESVVGSVPNAWSCLESSRARVLSLPGFTGAKGNAYHLICCWSSVVIHKVELSCFRSKNFWSKVRFEATRHDDILQAACIFHWADILLPGRPENCQFATWSVMT